jgi:hypothetical protein
MKVTLKGIVFKVIGLTVLSASLLYGGRGQNRFYVRLTETQLQQDGAVRLRGTNAINEYCPSCQVFWKRRSFFIDPNDPYVTVWLCNRLGECEQSDTSELLLNDMMVLDAYKPDQRREVVNLVIVR